MSVEVIPAEFTLNDLLAFIEGQAQEVPDGHYTTQEWADHFGVSDGKMRRIMKQVAARGGLSTREVKRTSPLNGRPYTTWVYGFIKEEIST